MNEILRLVGHGYFKVRATLAALFFTGLVATASAQEIATELDGFNAGGCMVKTTCADGTKISCKAEAGGECSSTEKTSLLCKDNAGKETTSASCEPASYSDYTLTDNSIDIPAGSKWPNIRQTNQCKDKKGMPFKNTNRVV